MTKVEIIALAEKWEAAAQRAEARYQDSGAARHLREKEQAEDLAAALWIAADGADDHGELISLKCDLNQLAAWYIRQMHALARVMESIRP